MRWLSHGLALLITAGLFQGCADDRDAAHNSLLERAIEKQSRLVSLTPLRDEDEVETQTERYVDLAISDEAAADRARPVLEKARKVKKRTLGRVTRRAQSRAMGEAGKFGEEDRMEKAEPHAVTGALGVVDSSSGQALVSGDLSSLVGAHSAKGPESSPFGGPSKIPAKLNTAMAGADGALRMGHGASKHRHSRDMELYNPFATDLFSEDVALDQIRGTVESKVPKKDTKLETPGLTGGAEIMDALDANQPKVDACLNTGRRDRPMAAGRITVHMQVAQSGRVSRAFIESTAVNDAALEACILRQVRRFRFPKHTHSPMAFTHFYDVEKSKTGKADAAFGAGQDPMAAVRTLRPETFMGRTGYFENTYLGGNAAYIERLRKLATHFAPAHRPYLHARSAVPSLDAPADAGLSISATLDRAWVDQPQRVLLQIGIQGSRRYGWRRPPLDVALVVDPSAMGGAATSDAVQSLIRRLGPQDRLGVIMAQNEPQLLADLDSVDALRLSLARVLDTLPKATSSGPAPIAAALELAGQRLRVAANHQARVPGTQLVLLLTSSAPEYTINEAKKSVHRLTVQGAVTSVISLSDKSGWWQVANAGHGNLHQADDNLAEVIDAELASISKVIARLLRLNIKLAPNVEAIRVLGSRILEKKEIAQVKAREEATDRNLSRTMGVAADRGDDDDGIQTVIPYFYGGDSHVILVELWVDEPGPIADVTLKYKDMVKLENATAQTAAWVPRTPRAEPPTVRMVRDTFQGYYVAEALAAAGKALLAHRRDYALRILTNLAVHTPPADTRLVAGMRRLVADNRNHRQVADALFMAQARRIGLSAIQ